MKRKKSKNRTKISFVATILVLSVAALVAYSFSFQIPSYSIPSNLPPYSGIVGTYAPSDSLLVTFDNYTAIRGQNASAVPNDQLVDLVSPGVTVRNDAVQQRVLVTILNQSIGINNTATVATLSPGAFSNLSAGFGKSGLVPLLHGGFSLYNVTDKSNGRTKQEWLTLDTTNEAVLFAEGGTDARSTVEQILSVRSGTIPSILSQMNVTRELFSAGGIAHLAFAIQNFPVEVLTSKSGVLAVDVVSGHVQITHIVRFASSGYASSQVGEVKSVYRYASDFSQYEENVKAVEVLSLTSLQEAVDLAGE
jgi:hypothetical protein